MGLKLTDGLLQDVEVGQFAFHLFAVGIQRPNLAVADLVESLTASFVKLEYFLRLAPSEMALGFFGKRLALLIGFGESVAAIFLQYQGGFYAFARGAGQHTVVAADPLGGGLCSGGSS